MTEIVDLAHRLAVTPEARHVLSLMKCGPAIERALAVVLPALPKLEQRALITVVAFRMMGSMLPANITLLERMPPLAGISAEEIMAAFQALVDQGILILATPQDQPMAFYWPALERLVHDALRDYEAPAIVGLDGRPMQT